ncbi:MAG: hypothetical protein KIT22_00470 [Verrucomicrobiae bacterium]|nr:hypothetical protein [Verrucomicrobiae bacterium]
MEAIPGWGRAGIPKRGMMVQKNVETSREKFSGDHWVRWMAGMGACVLLAAGQRILAIEPEDILSPNFGKFAIQPQFDFSAQFNDNLFYGEDDPRPGGPVVIDREIGGEIVPVTIASPPQNGVESDLLWYLTPGLELQYGSSQENSLSLGYSHDFILYTKNDDFNRGQDRFQFDARTQFGRFTLVGSDTVAWLNTILGGSVAVSQRVPVRRLSWQDNYRLTYDSSVKTDVYVVFAHDLQDFLQSISLYDQGTMRGTVGFTYKPTERLGAFVEASGGHTDVEANSLTMLPGQDSWVYRGVRRRCGARLLRASRLGQGRVRNPGLHRGLFFRGLHRQFRRRGGRGH